MTINTGRGNRASDHRKASAKEKRAGSDTGAGTLRATRSAYTARQRERDEVLDDFGPSAADDRELVRRLLSCEVDLT